MDIFSSISEFFSSRVSLEVGSIGACFSSRVVEAGLEPESMG